MAAPPGDSDGNTPPSRARMGIIAGAVLGLTGIVVASIFGLTALSGTSQQASSRHAWATVMLLVSDAHLALLDEVLALGEDALDNPKSAGPSGDDVVRAAAEREAVLGSTIVGLDDLIGDPHVGPNAADLVDLFEDLPPDGDDLPIDDLLALVNDSQIVVETANSADPVVGAMSVLLAHSWLPRQVGSDVQDWRFLMSGQVAAWVDGYFNPDSRYIEGGDAGWFGSPPAPPLPSPYVTAGMLPEEFPLAWDEMRQILAGPEAQPMLAFDAWISEWPTRASETPPVTLEATLSASRTVTAQFDSLVQASLLEVQQGEGAARATAGRLWLALIGTLCMAVLAAAALVIRAIRGYRRDVSDWREAALVDQLTGLANRRGLQAHTDALGRERPTGHALLLFDMDHFKGINDQYGHAVGDHALTTIARLTTTVADGIPGQAIPVRLGGDEFVILAHDLSTPEEVGNRAADDLIRAVTTAMVPIEDGAIPLSVSVGIASSIGPVDLDDLLLKADMALYEVKRGGRGAHAAYQSLMPSGGTIGSVPASAPGDRA